MSVTTSPVEGHPSPIINAWYGVVAAADALSLGLMTVCGSFAFLLLTASAGRSSVSLSLLVAGGFWLGLFTASVPSAIRAPRLAFPHVHALGMWLYLAGGLVICSSENAENIALGLLIAAAGLIAMAIDLVVTIVAYKEPTFRYRDFNMLSFSAFVTSIFVMIGLVLFVVGQVIYIVTLHYSNPAVVPVLTRSARQLLGAPAAYLLLLPALGAAAHIVDARSARGLIARPLIKILLVAQGLMALGASAIVWESGRSLSGHFWIIPLIASAPALIVAALLFLSLFRGRPTIGADLIAVLLMGAMVLVIGLHLNDGEHRDSALLAIGALAALGCLWNETPRLINRSMTLPISALGMLGVAVGLSVWSGVLTRGLATYLLGADRTVDSSDAGAVIAIVGVALFLFDFLFASMRPVRDQTGAEQ